LLRLPSAFYGSPGQTQGKGTVAEYPNERTVRYYISSGLLTSASEKRGLKSVFGYEHLLKLLTIKKLQADGLPISVIKDLISDKSIEDLEKLFGEEIRVFDEREELESFRQALANPESAEFAEYNISACEEPPAEAQKVRRENISNPS
jgi:DNA-binding transcriptional MerR regulator